MKKVITLKVAVYLSDTGNYFSVGLPFDANEDIYKQDTKHSTFVKFEYFATEVEE